MKHNQNDKINKGGFDAPKTPVRDAAENIIEGANQEDQLEQMKKQAEKDSANSTKSHEIGTPPNKGREPKSGE